MLEAIILDNLVYICCVITNISQVSHIFPGSALPVCLFEALHPKAHNLKNQNCFKFINHISHVR